MPSHPSSRSNVNTAEQAVQDAVSDNYEHLRHALPYARAYHEWWLKQIIGLSHPDKRNGVVLDNACGIGVLFDFLPDAKALYGLDLSFGMLTKASQRGAYVIQGDSTLSPFPDETFDLIIAHSLLHHLPEPEIGVREMHRILKSGGQVVLVDTNKTTLNTLPRRVVYRSQYFSDYHTNLAHEDYINWVTTYFTVERVQFLGYLAFPFAFPDLMGPMRNIPFPVTLVKSLIQVDHLIAQIPLVKKQAWIQMVSAFKRAV